MIARRNIVKGIASLIASCVTPIASKAGMLINPYAFGGIDSYTVLQLSCDGTDASTSFPDDANRHTVTAIGNAQVDTAQSKFGGASALLDGTGDYLSVPDSTDWDFGTGDFTIEMFVRFNTLPAAGAERGTFIGQRTDDNNVWHFMLDFIDNLGVLFRYSNGGVVQIGFNQGSTAGWAINTWYHVCLERAGTTFRAYRDGSVLASATDADSMPTLSGALIIGGAISDVAGSSHDLDGWIDELRVSKDIARYNGAFTPPTAPF